MKIQIVYPVDRVRSRCLFFDIPGFNSFSLGGVRALAIAAILLLATAGWSTTAKVFAGSGSSLIPYGSGDSTPASITAPADTLVLEELRILAPRIEKPDHQQPVQIQSIDPVLIRASRQESAAYLIDRYTFANIRDYGPGNMATVSQRGFPPGQTRILWEELPLNHPMLGLIDLSLIPAGLLDGISASSGNPASMTGSGGIGGTISLRTTQPEERAFISQSIGSYGRRQTGAGASVQRGGFEGAIRAYHQRSDNDFDYVDPVRGQKRTRNNNGTKGDYMVAQGRYTHHDWQFRSLMWVDDVRNELPGAISALSPARQDDRSFRWLGQAGYSGFERMQLSTTAGWYHYELDYTNLRTNRTEASTSRLFLMQPAIRYAWTEAHESRITAQWAHQTVESDNYADPVDQNNVSVRLRHSWDITRHFGIHPAVEAAVHTEFHTALNPALGLTLQPMGESLTIRGMISRNQNNPSFNDLYWAPGGNPDLQPETVLSYESGISWQSEHGSTSFGFSATLFRHDFEEGIRWRPGSDGYFTPGNIEDIRSRGVEGEVNGGTRINAIRINAHYMITRTRISIKQERFPGDDSVNRQMIYVPEWVHKGGLRLAYRDLIWVHLSAQYTGERYTTFDHSAIRDPLDAFSRADLDLGTEWSTSTFRINASAGIRNLGDRQYEVMQWYPTAPRHYQITLSVSLI